MKAKSEKHKFFVGNTVGTRLLGDLCLGGEKLNLQKIKWGGLWNEFVCLRTGTGSGLLRKWK
jgi:hypothetical protein